MAAHVQNLGSTGNGTAGQTSLVLSPSSKTVTVGNTIVVGFGTYFDITASGITDNLGNVYARVERIRNASGTEADIWSAPVTVGGSITTITVSFASTQYLWMTAAEFSGLASSPTVGSGTTGSAASPAKWASAVTIPISGAAIGAVTNTTNAAQTAGANSGSPSTALARSAFFDGGGNISGSLVYALGGASQVTSFDGTTALAPATGTWSGAGGVFGAAIAVVPRESPYPQLLVQ